MYLSQLLLNPKNKRVQAELSNPYELHRTLMRAFPEQLPADERVLYRVEPVEESGPVRVLLQSLYQPDWEVIQTTDYFFNLPQIKSFTPHFSSGQVYYFRLLGNPTKKIRIGDGKNSKRVGLYRVEEQEAWLKRKAQDSGFNVVEMRAAQHQHQISYKKAENQEEKRKKLTHQGVRFEGLLEITDSVVFAETIKNGIGSGKAFGFGLLSLVKI